MPASPEFIPLAKQKEMFAVSSWRDSPQTTPSHPPAPPPPEKDLCAPLKSHRSRRSRGRGKAPAPPHNPDVDDFFVHVVLPSGVPFATLQAELMRHATTPLRALDVGSPRVLFPRRPGPREEDGADGALFGTPMHRPEAEADGAVAALPDLALPPSVPSEILQKGHLISLLFAESGEAGKVREMLQRRWPAATVMVASRNRAVLNASLVLKGLPSLAKTERIIAELDKAMPQRPSYIRLHRGERGVFKNVLFVKYPNREVAEESKLRLERFVIGSRLLKVEFKKKEKGTAERERGSTLQQLVRELRLSAEHEGFVYQRADLSKDEVKALKQLCQSYGLAFDLLEQTVTVRRILPVSGRPSPAMRPMPAAPPSLTPTAATPGGLRPMDFKGIRHWKEISQGHALGIARPKGPGDVPPFAPGRGRPI